MSRVLLLCRRGPLWQRHGCLVTSSTTSVARQQRAQFLSPKQSQTGLSGSLICSVRFYTLKGDVLETPLPRANVQTEVTAKRQEQRGSPFLGELQACISPAEVLDVTCGYSLTVCQVTDSLNTMRNIIKLLSVEQERKELLLLYKHPGLEKLLKDAMRTVGLMSLFQVTLNLLTLMKLHIPQESRVVQLFLRVCQDRLNELDSSSLSNLCACLRYMDDSPNIVALKNGMRLFVEANLHEINADTLQIVVRVLVKGATKELQWKLENQALSQIHKFSPLNAEHMINVMAATGFYSEPLVFTCSKKILGWVHTITAKRLLELLDSYRKLKYMDREMFAAISNCIKSRTRVLSNPQLVSFLVRFELVAFCPDAFMKAFAGKVIAERIHLTVDDLLMVLKVYSSLGYDLQERRSDFLNFLTSVLSSHMPKMSAYQLLKSVYHLCLLGHFPSAPLEQVLNSNSLEKLYHLTNMKMEMLQTLDLCLRIDRPALPQPLSVPSYILRSAFFSESSANLVLTQCLENLLEEQAYAVLQKMVVVEKFYCIDAVITKKGKSSQRAAVILTSPSSFCYGTSRPRGSLAIKLRHLKILGYQPVLVSEDELLSMPEERRTDFLRMLIFPQHRRSEEKLTF